MNPQRAEKRLLFVSTLAGVLAVSTLADAGSGTVRLVDANATQIKALQRELSARGLYDDEIDGVPGPRTRAALRSFQTRRGITVSGEIDRRSADALGLTTARVEGLAAQPPNAAELNRALGAQPVRNRAR